MDGAATSLRIRPATWRARVLRGTRSNVVKALVAAQLIALLVVAGRSLGWLQPAELLVYDRLVVAWAGHRPSDRVVLVGATESDIHRYRWPLSDGDVADLLLRLEGWRPRVIGVDLYRDYPVLPGTARLSAVLAAHPNIVWAFKLPGRRAPGVPPPQELRGSDRAVLTDIPVDAGDKAVRRALLFADNGVTNFAGIGMALAERYLASDGIGLGPGPNGSLKLGKAVIAPLDDTRGPYVTLDARGYQMLIDYRGGEQPFAERSVADIMDRSDAAPLIRGRAVIVGVTGESVKDDFITPFNTLTGSAPPLGGIALHAHIADQLIREGLTGGPFLDFLPRGWEDGWIWLWAMGGALAGWRLRGTVPALAAVGSGLAILAATVYAAFGAALLLPGLPAAFAWIGAAGLTNRLLHAASNRERAQLRRSFEHYLPPAVIAEMMASRSLPRVGGERREISVLFTDISNFTTLSEAMAPETLAALLNEYFAGACSAVFEHGGLVYEFIGDAILSFFNAPHEQADHADRAVDAAMALDRFACTFSAAQRRRGIDFGTTRVGVHTGVAFVGNIGTPARLKYTALGDMLNTGSRLEGLNKVIGTRICVSGETVAKSRRHVFRPVGDFVVKGRHSSVEVFEPVTEHIERRHNLERYGAAYRALAAGDNDAAERFAALRRDDPDDRCVAFHCRRLADGQAGTLIVMSEK
jgi:adenylate cyclase